MENDGPITIVRTTNEGIDPGQPIKWDSWPFRDEKKLKSYLLVLCIILSGPLFFYVLGSLYAILAPALLFFSLNGYFLPRKYVLDETGITSRLLSFENHKSWNYYNRYCISKEGIFLSPLSNPSRLDSFRGLFLKFNKKVDMEKVVKLVKKQLD